MSLRATAVKHSRLEPGNQCAARRRLRVLHFISSFEVGGTEIQLAELLKRIDRDSYDVRLACIHNRGPLYSEALRLSGEIPEFPLRRFYDLNALAQILKLRSLLVAEEIDIVHTHDFYSGLLGSVAARLADVRVLASQRHLKLSDRRVHHWGTRLVHRLSNMVLVNSEAVRGCVLDAGVAGFEKVIVIRNGLRSSARCRDRNRAETRARILNELGLAEPVRLIVTIARLDAVKGHRFLIDAASSLSRDYPSLHYVIIGDGQLRSVIGSQVFRLGLQDRVHLLGERNNVLEMLPGFDLSVLPSLQEGFPNAVMESMAAGVPVVGTSVGGTLELIDDRVTGYLVPAGDAAALARQIAFAVDNPDLTWAIAGRGRDFVNNEFDIDRMVASVQETYTRLMAMPA